MKCFVYLMYSKLKFQVENVLNLQEKRLKGQTINFLLRL